MNRRRAIRRLRAAIALHVRTPVDLEDYAGSKLFASSITMSDALQIGRRDQRYQAVVCEVLDLFAACDARVREAAGYLGVSTAHLVKFFRNDPKLWQCVGQMRAAARIKPLR